MSADYSKELREEFSTKERFYGEMFDLDAVLGKKLVGAYFMDDDEFVLVFEDGKQIEIAYAQTHVDIQTD